MSNPYVYGGYLAVAAILGVYVWHLRRRARVLARALPRVQPASSSSRASAGVPSESHPHGEQGSGS